jgi:2-methylcitrate dehydratase PrpD
VSGSLAALVGRLYTEPAPQAARARARLLILDTLGCALAAMEHSKVRALRASLDDRGAFLAIAACWDEACEGLPSAHGRPGVPVIAACLARGMGGGRTLQALVDAVVTGYEVGGRMGARLRIKPGMHVDASWPSLGVAAAVARLLGGSPAAAQAAIEIAAAQVPFSLYLPVAQGADARNTYLGHAAWLGAYAAQCALAGVEAPRGAVDEFARLALGGTGAPLDAPGHVILDGYIKPFAAVRHVHYGALAALRLLPRIGKLGDVKRIALSIYPEAITYCGNRAPQAPIQAQFSLSFGVAAALRLGRLDADAYRAPAFDDPELRRLEALVEVGSHGRAARDATLEVDGVRESVDSIPMSDAEVEAKFLRNASPGLGDARAREMADALLRRPEAQSLQAVFKEGLPA